MRSHIVNNFDRSALARICAMPERQFGKAFGMEKVVVPESRWVRKPDDFYFFQDNGADVLAVAHLDTVVRPSQRTARFVDTKSGPVVQSGALDDRLGAFIILDLLPNLGIKYDVLLTVGEETGNSTAQHFTPDKDYNYMIEFDRGGTDVVMYQYDDDDARARVRQSGAIVGNGIFSDICYLDHLGIKGFNWGVGYRDYHSTRAHAYLDDTYMMVEQYVRFHGQNEGVVMPFMDFGLDDDDRDDDNYGYGDWWRDVMNEVDADEPDAVMDQLRRELANGIYD